MHENGEKKEGPEGQNSLSILNYTQITTNNISGLLCRSRPLRFIEDQLSLKNRTVKNTSRKIKRSFGYVSTRDTLRPGKTVTKNANKIFIPFPRRGRAPTDPELPKIDKKK